MKYMGSKNRIAKFILPIMAEEAEKNGITTWVEPFVGGANIIDKVPNRFKKIGIDYNPHTIKALIAIRDLVDELPTEVSVEYYKSLRGTDPDPITSLIRFGCSFGGTFENGYARRDGKSMWMECVRNAQKQSPKLQNVELINASYDKYDFTNCLIYCDPPYKETTSYKTGKFDHDKFWQWCRKMSKKNIVFVSEYEAPDDFICIWQGNVKTNFASQRSKATNNAVEKLFKI
ncbi:MAG: DNA adenine methylase [Bacteroidales bacterium]